MMVRARPRPSWVARLQAKGVGILKRDDSDDNGRFVWIVDPEGNKVELWEPKRAKPSTR